MASVSISLLYLLARISTWKIKREENRLAECPSKSSQLSKSSTRALENLSIVLDISQPWANMKKKIGTATFCSSSSAISLPDKKTRDRTISTYLLISHATTSPRAKLLRPSAVIITKLNFTKMWLPRRIVGGRESGDRECTTTGCGTLSHRWVTVTHNCQSNITKYLHIANLRPFPQGRAQKS